MLSHEDVSPLTMMFITRVTIHTIIKREKKNAHYYLSKSFLDPSLDYQAILVRLIPLSLSHSKLFFSLYINNILMIHFSIIQPIHFHKTFSQISYHIIIGFNNYASKLIVGFTQTLASTDICMTIYPFLMCINKNINDILF